VTARDATREEEVLFREYERLRAYIAARRTPEVVDLLATIPSSAFVILHAHDFALLREQAQDEIEIETQPGLVHRGIVGQLHAYDQESGEFRTTYLVVRADAVKGDPVGYDELPLPPVRERAS
jgi:hypothetical protein